MNSKRTLLHTASLSAAALILLGPAAPANTINCDPLLESEHELYAVGDINGDNYDDVVFAERDVAAGEVALHVISGMDGATLTIITNALLDSLTGGKISRLAGAGDVNNDGVGDLIIGTLNQFDGDAFVLSGSTGEALYYFGPTTSNEKLGSAVLGAGDLDNDGHADFVISSYSLGGTSSGRVYVFSGQHGDTLFVFDGTTNEDMFGWSIAMAGDADNDGVNDIIVGAPGTRSISGFGYTGSAWVYSGADGSLIRPFLGQQVDDQFGYVVAGLGDVDGDGYAEVLVGAPWHTFGPGLRNGRVYVESVRFGIPLVTMDGTTQSKYGTYLDRVGDASGDGIPDFVLGAFAGTVGDPMRLEVRSGIDGALINNLYGPDSSRLLKLGAAGDLDNDGALDLLLTHRTFGFGTTPQSTVLSLDQCMDVVRVPEDQPTIQAGIDAVSDGGIVLISPGTYTGVGNHNINFGGKNITVRSKAGPETTIIDCAGSGARAFTFNGGEQSSATVEGLTITGGSAEVGGAVYITSASPTFRNCRFIGNQSQVGGAVMCASFSAPWFYGCVFAGNVAVTDGFDGSGGKGGAIYNDNNSSCYAESCTFTGNAVIISNPYEDSNPAGQAIAGGAATLVRCILAFNGIDDHNPAYYLNGTVVDDCAVTVSCTDVFGNFEGDWISSLSGLDAENNNFSANPLFCDTAGGDYHIAASSPCAAASSPCGETVGALGIGQNCAYYNGPVWFASVFGSDTEGEGSELFPFATIQRAIDKAADGDTILIESGEYSGSMQVNVVSKELTLASRYIYSNDPSDATATTVLQRVLFSKSSGLCKLVGLTVAPGVVTLESELEIRGCRIIDGEGIRAEEATLSVSASLIAGNQYSGLHCDSSVVEIRDSRFTGNTNTGSGGAIQSSASTVNIISTVFDGNVAGPVCICGVDCYFPICFSGKGGAISFSGNLNVENCSFARNMAVSDSGYSGGSLGDATAGAIFGNAVDDSLVVINSIFYGNHADSFAIQASGFVDIRCTDIFGNSGGNWVGSIAGLDSIKNNFSADPLFCDTANGDYHIAASSPCAAANSPCGELVGALGVGCSAYSGPVWYVATDGDDSTGDGSVAAPFATIQRGIDAAADGDTVLVNDGTYGGQGDEIHVGKSIFLISQNGPNATVLEYGKWGGDILVSSDTVRMDGFTILETQFTAINSHLQMDNATFDQGYGIYALDIGLGSAHINNSEFKSSRTGLRCISSSVTIENCDFHDNTNVVGCGIGPIGGNFCVGGEGAGLNAVDSEVKIIRSNFIDNIVSQSDESDKPTLGGAIYYRGASTLEITECLFKGNSSVEFGGAIYIDADTSAIINISNNIFFANAADTGGAIYYKGTPQGSELQCNDFFANGAITLSQQIVDQLAVNNNFSADPLFCDTANGDYHIAASSPCAAANSPCGELVGALGVGCSPSLGQVWYVSVSGDDSTGDGSEALPFATIQRGVDAASEGDTVIVARGRYTGGGNRGIHLGSKDLVLISENGPGRTIIDCEGTEQHPFRALEIGTSYGSDPHTVVIKGFTLTNGYASDFPFTEFVGGAALIENTNVTFSECLFTNNHAKGQWIYGEFGDSYQRGYGAALASFNSSVKIENCTFVKNSSGLSAVSLNSSDIEVTNSLFAMNSIDSSDYAVIGPVRERGAVIPDTSSLSLQCSNVYGNAQGDWIGAIADQANSADNFSSDPLFCDTASGNYRIANVSLCAPANSPCGELVGALGVGCFYHTSELDSLIVGTESASPGASAALPIYLSLNDPPGQDSCLCCDTGPCIICNYIGFKTELDIPTEYVTLDSVSAGAATVVEITESSVRLSGDHVPAMPATLHFSISADAPVGLYEIAARPSSTTLLEYCSGYDPYLGDIDDTNVVIPTVVSGGIEVSEPPAEASIIAEPDTLFFESVWGPPPIGEHVPPGLVFVSASDSSSVPYFAVSSADQISLKTPTSDSGSVSGVTPDTFLVENGALVDGVIYVYTQDSVVTDSVIVIAESGTVELVAQLDIKPGSCVNPLNVNEQNSQSNGVIPVAIVGAGGFDVRDIDPATLLLESVAPLRWSFEDVSTPSITTEECACVEGDGDGVEDMTLKFRRSEIITALGDITGVSRLQLTLTGALVDGTEFTASDCVEFRPKERAQADPLHPAGEPDNYVLVGSFPNPFNPSTKIVYGLPEGSHVTLEVYNIRGQLVATLADGYRDSGYHTVAWDASDFASGVYFTRFTAAGEIRTRKIILLK